MSKDKPLLTGEQVNAVLEFAQGLYAADQFSNYGYYSPWMSNQNLIDLNNNGKSVSMDTLTKALEDYKASGEALQDYVEFMRVQDELFARTLDYYAGMLAFDLQVIPKNVTNPADFNSEEYRRDKERIYRFLDSFDYKSEFGRVVKELLRHETDFVWFRRTKWGNKGMKGTLQLLPQKRCMLTGYWEKGLLFSFDMGYFLQPGIDINGFDPTFKRYFKTVFDQYKGIDNYVPSNPLGQQDGTYAFWTQTSPEDGAWCFKFDTSNFSATPHFAPLLKAALRNEKIAELQYNKDIAGAYAILVGDIRLFDNAKSGTKSDQFAIAPKTLGGFMRKVKDGLPNGFKAVAMPTEGSKMYQYQDSNTNALKDQMATSGSLGASASRLIYSSDRMSNAEIENAILTDGNLMKALYPQFENFLEYFANKLTTKYKFGFRFEGINYEFERTKRAERLFKFADKGIVLNSSAFAAVMGMTPQDFDRSLAEGHNGDFTQNLTMLLNANTSKDGGSGGRPRSEDITDSGAASRDGLDY